MKKTLVYVKNGEPVKINDEIYGCHRLDKYFANIAKIHTDHVEIIYNGDVKKVKVSFDLIGAKLV